MATGQSAQAAAADTSLHAEAIPKDAPAPFNKATANIILRTVDLVDFRVREGILAEASSFFEAMFSLPPLSNDSRKRRERDDDQEYRDDVPVIRVSETSRALNNLLRFCYPVENPEMSSAGEICEALEASKKYCMEQAEKDVQKQFDRYAEREPLKLYALAAQHHWQHEMKIAAKGCLSIPLVIGTWIPEMEAMGAGAYMRLQVYHNACSSVASAAILRDLDPSSHRWQCSAVSVSDRVWFGCSHSPEIDAAYRNYGRSSLFAADFGQHSATMKSSFMVGTKTISAASWFMDYLKALRAEVQIRPRGRTVLNSTLTTQYITIGNKECVACAARVSPEMLNLRQALVAAVDVAVSRVQLEIKD